VLRNFPLHTLQEALEVPQKIQDERAGRPFKKILLADALGYKPGSSGFRDILSSSYKYGLTDGTEKAEEVSLTPLGGAAVQTTNPTQRRLAVRRAALKPPLFEQFFAAYQNNRIPSPDMLRKMLVSDYDVPKEFVEDCARILMENGRFANLIRDVGGSPYVMMDDNDGDAEPITNEASNEDGSDDPTTQVASDEPAARGPEASGNGQPAAPKTARPIFIAHGKKQGPLEKLQKILAGFQIPYRVVVDEPNLARPIPQKVRDNMNECGSAILIFTCDEKFKRDNGDEVWRPSENVVYELGAASFAYGDKVVIFKEKGIHFPTNFQSIGYIEFEENAIEAKTADLLRELIGFGLLKVTPT
jgi:predicted nucleotide-binding protein